MTELKDRIERVDMFTNGTVMVFNYLGEQVAELQGKLYEVLPKIIERAHKDTVFTYVQWGGNTLDCNFKEWFE